MQLCHRDATCVAQLEAEFLTGLEKKNFEQSKKFGSIKIDPKFVNKPSFPQILLSWTNSEQSKAQPGTSLLCTEKADVQWGADLAAFYFYLLCAPLYPSTAPTSTGRQPFLQSSATSHGPANLLMVNTQL